jgi:hypothetical protein
MSKGILPAHRGFPRRASDDCRNVCEWFRSCVLGCDDLEVSHVGRVTRALLKRVANPGRRPEANWRGRWLAVRGLPAPSGAGGPPLRLAGIVIPLPRSPTLRVRLGESRQGGASCAEHMRDHRKYVGACFPKMQELLEQQGL